MSKEDNGRIDKILDLRYNYSIGRTKTIFERLTNLNLNSARLFSETDQIKQGEVRFQIKRSAIHWTCKDEDVLAVQRFIESCFS